MDSRQPKPHQSSKRFSSKENFTVNPLTRFGIALLDDLGNDRGQQAVKSDEGGNFSPGGDRTVHAQRTAESFAGRFSTVLVKMFGSSDTKISNIIDDVDLRQPPGDSHATKIASRRARRNALALASTARGLAGLCLKRVLQ